MGRDDLLGAQMDKLRGNHDQSLSFCELLTPESMPDVEEKRLAQSEINVHSSKVECEESETMPRRRHYDEKPKEREGLPRLLDEFAEDTAMLGFRYVHSRYKWWFRWIWAFVLVFVIGLTCYQVYERITYYFIRNPLTTRRSFNSPTQVHFPTIGICNKMQLKASSIAERDAALLRALALAHDEYGTVTTNRSFIDSLQVFDPIDILEFHKNAHQKIEDLFLNCEFGQRSCLDENHIHPIYTPNGLCFAVSPNITIHRPGPETTLSLLLNLETHDIIPGMVPDPGVILSIYDKEEALLEQYTEGIHLEPGKTVTIPINEMRRLTRFYDNCGRKWSGPFSAKEYSMAACQWANTMAYVEKKCKCRPVHSPYHRAYMLGEIANMTMSNKTSKRSEKRIHVCTLRKELECVKNATPSQVLDAVHDKHSQHYCPEDCEDVTFSSIVFGGRLTPTEVLSLLPSDWDEIKEKKIAHFQKALDILPNDRIPVVRAVQKLAHEAQQFIEIASGLFHVHPNHSDITCFTFSEVPIFEHHFNQFRSHESIWERVSTYLQRSLARELNSTAECLGFAMSVDGSVNASTTLGQIKFNSSLLSLSLLQLGHLESALKVPDSVYGLKFMDYTTKNKIVELVLPFVREVRECVQKMYDTPDTMSEIGEHCRKIFITHYSTFLDAKLVYTFGNLDHKSYRDYRENMMKVVSAIQSAKYKNRVRMLDWHGFEINVRRFESLYREDGKDNLEILELLKLRKIMLSDLLELTNSLISELKEGIEARERFYAKIGLPAASSRPIEAMQATIECLVNITHNIPLLKKTQFLRGEWMSKVQRQVEVAQSYSVSPVYDRVNLLHIKLYFAHFKQETIVEERSYNMFLLLAEIGGTIGLYVGATLLTLAETIVFFLESRLGKIFLKPVKI